MAIITKRAFECAAGVEQRLWASVDHAKRTRDDAIPAAVANVVLHKHRANFGANDRSGGTSFEATSFLAMLANIRKKDPAKGVFFVSIT